MRPFEKKGSREVVQKQDAPQQDSDQFYFGPQNIRHIGKRTGRILRPTNNNSTFLRLSTSNESQDYLIVAKQQQSSFSEIPRQIEQNITQMQSSKQPELSKITKHVEECKLDDVINADHKQQKQTNTEIMIKQDQNRNLEKESRKSVDRRYGIVENSPFFVPNISSVKHRYSGGGRKSEQFLLQLLKTERSSKENHQIIYQNSNLNIDNNQNLHEYKQQEYANQGRKNQQQQEKKSKQAKKIQLNLQKQKNKQINRRQSQLIRDKREREMGEKPKSKRVTINDRGKIKLPTDSFSLQFNSVNPLQNYNKNTLNEIQERQEENQNLQQNHIKRKQSQQIIQDHKNQPSQYVRKQKKPKKQKPKSANTTKHSKSKSLKSKQNQEVQEKIQRKLTKKRKVEDNIDQKDQNLISKEVVSAPVNPRTGRPIRQRCPPQQFYKNQKVVYNNKNEVIMTGISTNLFLQILGYSGFKDIKNSNITYGSNYMKHVFKLKANEQLSSIGVDQTKLNQHLKSMTNFHKIWISTEKAGCKFIMIKIDNFPQQILDDKVYIQRNQRVQIKNSNQKQSYSIAICIERPANSQQQQEQQ